tara:strand:- start:290 stop:940 length:651 start_codon:yes stop_codon:yes gene_type:complete
MDNKKVNTIIKESEDLYYSDIKKSIKLLKELLENELIDSQKIIVLNKLGEYTEHAESISYFNKVLEIDPNNAFAIEWLGWKYQLMGKWKECSYYLRKAYKINPKDDFLYPIGGCLLEIGKYKDAIFYLEKALTKESKDSDVLGSIIASIGTAHLHIGNNEQAIIEFKKALKIEPDNQVALFNLNIAELSCGKTKTLKVNDKFDNVHFIKSDDELKN